MENLKVTGWNIRKCSVRLSRCDLSSRRSAARLEGGVPAAPHALMPPVACAASQVQEYATALAMVIKMENDDKDAFTTQESDSVLAGLSKYSVTDIGWRIKETNCEASTLNVEVESDSKDVVKQELVEEYVHTWENIKAEPDFTEACSSVLIVKSEMDENVIKEELELGPILLQSRTIPSVDSSNLKATASLARVDVQAGLADARPSTGCVGAAASGQLYTSMSVLSEPASGRNAGEYCYEEGSGVLSDNNIKLKLNETDEPYQKVIRKQFCGSSNSRDLSPDTREFVEKLYKCDEDVTTTETNMINNINTHLGINQCKCKQCEFSTSLLGNLKRHILTHTGEKRFKCEQCEYSASGLSNLKRHMHIHIGEKPYKCEQCEYSTSQLGTLKQHMYTHTGEKPYKCNDCEYNASQLSHFKQHMYTHTGEKPYKCKECEYKASQLSTLKNHMYTHTGEKPYKCKHCEYRSSRLGNLKLHMHTHTGEKPYNCKQCEYRAFQQSNLKQHMRTHTGEKPYKCKQCEYKASRLDFLKLHMQTHSGEKPYKCKQCEYSASQLSHLKRHMCIHTGEKPYKCKHCEYRTSELGNLKRHMHIHTGEKPYKCKQCEYSASEVGNLKKHMYTHTGEKPYKCKH